MRHPPALRYNGLTIIVSNPGRFDGKRLISGPSEKLLASALEGTSRFACDIREMKETAPLLPDTKCVLLCGEASVKMIGQQWENFPILRGSPLTFHGIPYIPTYHPQDAWDPQPYERRLNPHDLHFQPNETADVDEDRDEGDVKDFSKTSRANYQFWFCADTHKALDICRNGVRRHTSDFAIRPPIEEAIEFINSAEDRLYLDIETDIETQQMICLAFSKDASRVMCVPFIDRNWQHTYTIGEKAALLRALALAFGRCTVIAHNALFDLFILLWKYKMPPPPQGQIFDTMIAHHRLHIGVEKSLGHCGSLYTHQPYHKHEAEFNPHTYEQELKLWTYNAKDVELMALVHEEQLKLAKERNALTSIAVGNSLVRPLLLKQYRGLALDTTSLCSTIDECRKRCDFFEERVLSRLVGHLINPRSPAQIANYLYNEVGIEVPKGDDSLTDKKQLYKLLVQYSNFDALKVILHCRQLSKEAGSLTFRLWRENRVTCAYAVARTKSFRLASSKLLGTKKKDTGWGTNLQNWKKQWRSLVVPTSKDFVFLQVDQAGAEAKIVAWLTSEKCKLRHLFLNKVKPHTYVAMHLFREVWETLLGESLDRFCNAEISELKAQPRWKELEDAIKASDNNLPSKRYYYLAKQTCHSANYDIKAPTFVMNLLDKSEGKVVISVREGDRFLSLYHSLFPEIRAEFHGYVKACVFQRRELRNMFDHPRFFHGMTINTTLLKDCYSWIPQSTVGQITNIADCEIQERLDTGVYNGFAVLQNNHDSLLVQCALDDTSRVAPILQHHMNRELTNYRGEKFTMGSEVSIGNDWYHMKELR